MSNRLARQSRRSLVRSLAGTGVLAALAWVGSGPLLAIDIGSAQAQVAQPASTDNSTSDRARPFTGSASGALAGGQGGHFAYFKFQYPANATVTLTLWAGPNDPVVLEYAGYKVYGPSAGREYLSVPASRDAGSTVSADLFSPDAGEYVVQVYNYAPNPDATVTFTLSSPNLPPQPAGQPAVGAPAAPAAAPAAVPAASAPAAPVAAPAAATDNSTASGALPFDGRASGAIAGAQGGRFAYFKFVYPGDQSRVTLNLQAGPNDAAILQYVGIKLYGPNPGREYISAGAQKDATPSATGDLVSADAGEYVIQVYNYTPNPDAVVTFELTASGLPPQPAARPAAPPAAAAPAAAAPVVAPPPAAAPAASADISTPERAASLAGSASRAIPGAQGGRFDYYKFSYSGDQRRVTINLQAAPNDPEVLKYVGFKVYGPTVGREYLSAGAQKDANPSASADLTTSEPGEYVVQVYNYVPNPETIVTYTISLSGL